ncbi:phage holin family protein [Acetivibrio thermocellus]|nr:phage holin family protein [Acetivibrio thermocellus]UWV46642.1 phage holin family protein [Acetivibrio thermocellus]HOP93712.1 phage holin family protein [Acetivibrio thermocellus]
MANFNDARAEGIGLIHFLIRLVVGAVVLAVTAALTPGFSITGFWPLILGAIVLAALDYIALRFLGIHASPYGRGITGFVLAAVIIYITQFFVAGYSVTLLGAVIGALVYGIIDAIIPGRGM